MSPGNRQGHRGASLRVTPAFRAFVLAQLESLGDVTSRSMFGGVGLYSHGRFFGIIARDVLYLKVDDSTRRDYVRQGMHAFQPYPHRSATFQYYSVPLGVLESGAELERWAARAVRAAAREAAPPRQPTRPARRRSPA